MKKVLLVLVAILASVSFFTSCSDSGTCYCESGLGSRYDEVYYDFDSEFCDEMDEIERITGGRCKFDKD